VDGVWATKIEGVRLTVRAVVKISNLQYVVLIYQRYRQTDDMRSQCIAR